MVTKMNERTSRNESVVANPLAASNAKQAEMLKATKEFVSVAIKSRTQSYADLKKAAAYALYMLIDFGHVEQFNRLFNELPNIDADALRQKFVAKVIDIFGAGGVWNETESKWTTRPVGFIAFAAKPAENMKGQHFTIAKTGDSEKDSEKRKLILESRENVRKAGVEALESIEWMSRAAVIAKVAVYDIIAFRANIARELIKAAKASVDPELKLSHADIRATMRALNFSKSETAEIELELMKATPPANTSIQKQEERETEIEESRVAA